MSNQADALMGIFGMKRVMNTPTEDGLYWAKIQAEWEPVLVQGRWIELIGTDLELPLDQVKSWGPKLEIPE